MKLLHVVSNLQMCHLKLWLFPFQERISTTTPHEAQSTSDMTRNKVMQPKETMGSSLRVLTLGVEGVKKWSQILSDGMLLFEVFGRVGTVKCTQVFILSLWCNVTASYL